MARDNIILKPTRIDGVRIAESEAIADDRGWFVRCYCQQSLSEIFQDRSIQQINQSKTSKVGSVRGLHFQYPPHAEMKLIRCLQGRVFDVAVDLRAGSPTFLHWHAEELTPENRRMIVIPEGFAHGFQVLEPDSELLYLHTAMYHKPSEEGVRYDDPRLAIDWPLEATEVSERDQTHAWLTPDFVGIEMATLSR